MTFSATGCISADEAGDCLFLSDSNHHRIIISTSTGEILDSVSELDHIWESLKLLLEKKGSCGAKLQDMFLFQIGCFPGFEDGEFESAKMLRPAATLYDEEDDCLYIVDSEVL